MLLLNKQLADTLPEVETVTPGDARADAQAQVNTLADSVEEFEARDTRWHKV